MIPEQLHRTWRDWVIYDTNAPDGRPQPAFFCTIYRQTIKVSSASSRLLEKITNSPRNIHEKLNLLAGY
jgi:hypothetical protein